MKKATFIATIIGSVFNLFYILFAVYVYSFSGLVFAFWMQFLSNSFDPLLIVFPTIMLVFNLALFALVAINLVSTIFLLRSIKENRPSLTWSIIYLIFNGTIGLVIGTLNIVHSAIYISNRKKLEKAMITE